MGAKKSRRKAEAEVARSPMLALAGEDYLIRTVPPVSFYTSANREKESIPSGLGLEFAAVTSSAKLPSEVWTDSLQGVGACAPIPRTTRRRFFYALTKSPEHSVWDRGTGTSCLCCSSSSICFASPRHRRAHSYHGRIVSQMNKRLLLR